MYKYLQLFSISWQNGFVYRTSVLLWRFRNFLATYMSLTVWSLLLANNTTIASYTQSGAITYVFLISLLQSLVLSTRLHGMSEFIYSGGLSTILTKPLNVFGYFAIQEVSDKLKNFLFLVLETGLIWLIFKPTIALPGAATVFLFILWTFGAIYLNALILHLLGAIGFWSPETWAPRFLFFTFLEFSAGKLFPLDILPAFIQKLIFMTPLPYLSFVQTKLFLEELDHSTLIKHSAMFIFWLVLGTISVRYVWQRGMRQYTAAGQ